MFNLYCQQLIHSCHTLLYLYKGEVGLPGPPGLDGEKVILDDHQLIFMRQCLVSFTQNNFVFLNATKQIFLVMICSLFESEKVKILIQNLWGRPIFQGFIADIL